MNMSSVLTASLPGNENLTCPESRRWRTGSSQTGLCASAPQPGLVITAGKAIASIEMKCRPLRCDDSVVISMTKLIHHLGRAMEMTETLRLFQVFVRIVAVLIVENRDGLRN